MGEEDSQMEGRGRAMEGRGIGKWGEEDKPMQESGRQTEGRGIVKWMGGE